MVISCRVKEQRNGYDCKDCEHWHLDGCNQSVKFENSLALTQCFKVAVDHCCKDCYETSKSYDYQ